MSAPRPVVEDLVSVVIPTYNRSKRVVRASESCLGQTHPSVEVIVVDDGSTDDTVEFLESYAATVASDRLRVIRAPHRGAWAARNVGLEAARGEYVQFLDSDDHLAPEKFSEQIAALRATGCDIALCEYEHEWEDPAHAADTESRTDPDAPYTTITMFTPLIRRSAIPEDVRFREMPLQQYDDQDFMLRVYLRSMRWTLVPKTLCYYVHHGGGQITDDRKRAHRPWFETFDALHRDFERHRDVVPASAATMIRHVGLGFARRLLHKGRRREVRSITRRLLRVPGPLRDRITAIRILIESYVPRSLFLLSRRLRSTR